MTDQMSDQTKGSDEAVTVRDNAEESRYEVLVGDAVAGFADYRRSEGRIDFTHTEISDEFGGRGLAKTLAATSLDEVREQGLSVRPYCGYYAGFIKKNPDYVDLVAEGDRAKFDLA